MIPFAKDNGVVVSYLGRPKAGDSLPLNLFATPSEMNTVSSRHAMLVLRPDGKVLLYDLFTNPHGIKAQGTWVRDNEHQPWRKVVQPKSHELKPGSFIALGTILDNGRDSSNAVVYKVGAQGKTLRLLDPEVRTVP